MRLLLLSPPSNVPHEQNTLDALFRNGLETFHLRKPEMERESYKDYLKAISPQFRTRLMIHSHHDLVQELSLKGVHYTEQTKPQTLTSHKTGCLQSAAFHSLQQLQEASTRFGAGLDYALLSPVFDSISKKGYRRAQFNRSELKSVLQAVPFSVYALGGVDVDKLEQVKELGFDGAALLGAIWEQADPVHAFNEMQEKCQST